MNLNRFFGGDKNNLTYRRIDTLFKTTNVRKFMSEFGLRNVAPYWINGFFGLKFDENPKNLLILRI
jgi:hypothetical protein